MQCVKWSSAEHTFFSRPRLDSSVNEMEEEPVVHFVIHTLQYKSGSCRLHAMGSVVELDTSHLLAIGPRGDTGGKSVTTRKLPKIESILIRYVCLVYIKYTFLGFCFGENLGPRAGKNTTFTLEGTLATATLSSGLGGTFWICI